MPRGSANFQCYINNLQRIYFIDFIDRLAQETDRRNNFRASIVGNVCVAQDESFAIKN